MANSAQEITFARASWDATVEAHLSLIDGLAPGDVSFYRDQVEAGAKGVLGVWVAGERVGSLVWALSDEPMGRVFIVEEMGAHHCGADLVGATNVMAHQFAPKMDAAHLRFMTRRQGMLRRMGGEYEVSYILEKTL